MITLVVKFPSRDTKSDMILAKNRKIGKRQHSVLLLVLGSQIRGQTAKGLTLGLDSFRSLFTFLLEIRKKIKTLEEKTMASQVVRALWMIKKLIKGGSDPFFWSKPGGYIRGLGCAASGQNAKETKICIFTKKLESS